MKVIRVAVAFWLGLVCFGDAANISNVTIDPPATTSSDSIFINAGGTTSANFVGIYNSIFSFGGYNQLQVDIYVETGMLQIIDSWSHSEPIGQLPAGTCSLTVNTYGV
jgi:hypothetical protein